MHSINSTTTCRKTYCDIIFMRRRPGSFWIEESHQKHSLMPIHRPNLMIHILVLACFHVGSCDSICLVSPEMFLAGVYICKWRHLTNHQPASSGPRNSATDSNLEPEPESEVYLDPYLKQFEVQDLEPLTVVLKLEHLGLLQTCTP